MTKSIKRRPDKSALFLLDDGSAPDFTQLGTDCGPTSERKAPGQTTCAAAQEPPRIFRSEKSLRQMMSEYNRSAPGFSPLKQKAPEPARNPATPDDFTFENIRQINLSTGANGITGKILRPKC